ncbi:hypothetical protein [Magnetospirillum sp. 15-1]|uniref:hypothetical protein n=1 Tax=Magnetospirillum sp. 15-1 TaxID=1979370 RepID=UPI00114471F9|nr:hypothetical protein [Magnetospirillum sp. 15-1]
MSVSAVSSVTATQTSYPILVNGFLCFSAADVAAARDFTNPRADQNTSAQNTSALNQIGSSQQYPRTINGQQVFNDAQAAAARNFTSANRPQTSGTRGTIFDFYA